VCACVCACACARLADRRRAWGEGEGHLNLGAHATRLCCGCTSSPKCLCCCRRPPPPAARRRPPPPAAARRRPPPPAAARRRPPPPAAAAAATQEGGVGILQRQVGGSQSCKGVQQKIIEDVLLNFQLFTAKKKKKLTPKNFYKIIGTKKRLRTPGIEPVRAVGPPPSFFFCPLVLPLPFPFFSPFLFPTPSLLCTVGVGSSLSLCRCTCARCACAQLHAPPPSCIPLRSCLPFCPPSFYSPPFYVSGAHALLVSLRSLTPVCAAALSLPFLYSPTLFFLLLLLQVRVEIFDRCASATPFVAQCADMGANLWMNGLLCSCSPVVAMLP